MTPAQCKAARSLLGWSYRELAARASMGHSTVINFEGGKHVKQLTINVLKRTLEDAGIEFFGDCAPTDTAQAIEMSSGSIVRLRTQRT